MDLRLNRICIGKQENGRNQLNMVLNSWQRCEGQGRLRWRDPVNEDIRNKELVDGSTES